VGEVLPEAVTYVIALCNVVFDITIGERFSLVKSRYSLEFCPLGWRDFMSAKEKY